MKLLLFDIDGTLIRSNSAGRQAMKAALEEMFGTCGPLDDYNMSGKTDARIITDLLTAVGIPQTEISEKISFVYELMAVKALEIYPGRGIMACEGVMRLLAHLQSRNDTLIGLLTGNSSTTAPLKLLAAGIEPTQFLVAAYGSDHLDRNHLPAIALNRASELVGNQITSDNMVVIGDTPADILCARAGKAKAIAVASGWHSAETLAGYHPDFLFEDLTDLPAVTKAMFGD